MKKQYIIANWKENKTTEEAVSWVSEFSELYVPHEDKEVILCPTFALLPALSNELKKLGLDIKLGSQNFPAFEEGAFTGEESPRLLKEFVDYAIIGHSERRNFFHETEDLLEKKVSLAKEYSIEPILCVQDAETPIHSGATLVAYEPIFAIGTGTPDTPENAQVVSLTIAKEHEQVSVIYGGSISGENVRSFTEKDGIFGVLVGSKSLNPQSFAEIITNA